MIICTLGQIMIYNPRATTKRWKGRGIRQDKIEDKK